MASRESAHPQGIARHGSVGAGWAAIASACVLWGAVPAFGEAMLQYFNTSWQEIAARIPELAEAGYSSLWLPPPTKGSGGLSVGYDLWDPFDLGGQDQRGTIRTRYGTEAELIRLVETAHRFGLRVYFDNIMNHRAFDVPGYNEQTPIDVYPGLVPEDFHLRVTAEGFYRKWDNTRNWGDAWQVMNLGLADLIDLAQEPGEWNQNFGRTEGATFPKIRFVRQPDRPEFYCYRPDGTYVGFGPSNGLSAGLIGSNTAFYAERVEDHLNRAARWLIDRTKADGLRLDAVKHVRADFFGATYGADKDSSDYGYLGQVQRQFNLTRGFSDAHHRDTVFDTEKPRDDAMAFGEHLGEPPAYGDYISAGMRLVDNPLRNELNGRLGSPWAGLNGFDQPGAGGFSPEVGVMHAQSHDNDYAARRELQHAFYFTRAGLGLLYTDGNHQAETLGESGGAFPRHANTAFLGQWSDPRIPNLLYVHEQFARGAQRGVWSDEDLVAYLRTDYREGSMAESSAATLLAMVNDNYAYGRKINDKGGAEGANVGFLPGDYLYNYSSYGGGFFVYGSGLKDALVPPGGYFLFSFKNPDPSDLWAGFGGRPITILRDGAEVGTVAVERRDGPNGDAQFNPYGLSNRGYPTGATPAPYTYRYEVPRVTAGTNLRFVARADGSAENILLRLDGGVDLNGGRPPSTNVGMPNNDPVNRDNPPALSWDFFLGFEQPTFIDRIHPELFAAVDTARNITGSAGAETYLTSGMLNQGSGGQWIDGDTVAFLYHDPTAAVGAVSPSRLQYDPADPEGGRRVWAKTNTGLSGYKVYLYFIDPPAWPEGAGGRGAGGAQTVELHWHHDEGGGLAGSWWRSEPLPAAFTPSSRYKIGAYRSGAPSWWPGDATSVARKKKMLTVFETPAFNAETVRHFPHNDYAQNPQGQMLVSTGLVDGFHLLSARAFLKRDGKASIYHTFKQTFYYDARAPAGEIRYPASDGESVGGQQYGAVVRTDPTVTEVWYHIDDADPNNDDVATGVANGNGHGFEPYSDGNGNGAYDAGESFTDLNTNGAWDADIGDAWVAAYAATPSASIQSAYPDEWRFNYVNIPPGGSNAAIRVRLREISSAPRAAFPVHTDASGRFTTLARTVSTWGPDLRLFVAWPRRDGDLVGPGYVMKAHFTKALADGLSDAELIDRFLIRLQSAESGRTDGGEAQSRALYSIVRNETADYHALAFALPNLYNEHPDWLHGIEVTLERPSLPALTASRLVKAEPVAAAPYIAIVEPPEYGPDGNPWRIVIPDVPSPTPEQRQTRVRVATATNGATVGIQFNATPAGFAGGMALAAGQPVTVGGSLFWDYAWTNLLPGAYRFTATVVTTGGASNSASRNATVILRQQSPPSESDLDDDDDGLLDADETTAVPLPNAREQSPKPNPEDWNNGEVHAHYAYGRSDPLSADTDGDGLPDALEVGWRQAVSSHTDTNADTNGDGYPNFQGDRDPPFYNTLDNLGSVPGVNSQSEGGDRSRQVAGSVTDPADPDTDRDGLPDGVEDRNRNGWVDGDGAPLGPADAPWLGRSWPNGRRDAGETWTETDPGNPDTDDDGLSDGHGEDRDFDGVINGDANTNRVHEAGEEWSETDPLNGDTDGDGLPDGWENRYGLDPLDDGADSLRTAAAGDGHAEHGAAGDPDGDGFTNLQELTNGTDPRWPDTGAPPPAGSITIGPGPVLGVLGGVTQHVEFADWTTNDLMAIDEYDGDGPNSQGGDVYRGWDGFDSSRDIVAFYARDGGAVTQGGDGRFYFRVDLHDLQAYAEEGRLDCYVVIDTGNPSVGEYALPDEVDTGTEMRWEAVVAVYQGNNGRVYVDTNAVNNSTNIGENLSARGVVARDRNSPAGFLDAYFNSELDAVEFSISRQALLDAGWNGDATRLNYQVFTTRDGTQNSPVGPGDIGGRSDIRDTIRDDWIASDYWRDQSWIAQHGVLQSWVGLQGDHDRGRLAHAALLIHGSQHVQPGSVTQRLLNNGAGAGYHRPVAAHEVFGQPLNLHLTATLACGLQWARTVPGHPEAWRLGWTANGPAFNARLRALVQSNVVHLLAGTFSDHALPYFSAECSADNIALAGEVLGRIYGASFGSNTVFWTPERLLDGDVLSKIRAAGFGFTVLDQETHLETWLGRATARGDAGYQLNRINGVGCFAINNQAATYLFSHTDRGLSMSLRQLLNRKARSSSGGQTVILFSHWEEFDVTSKADAYDLNLRWMANHPWVRVESLSGLAAAAAGGGWPVTERGDAAGARTSHLWINHSAEGNYDHWYHGSGQEEGLAITPFAIRPGVPLPTPYGHLSAGGLVSQAWARVTAIADTNLAKLARAAFHASLFETAFHNEDNGDLTRFSTGEFVWPDTSADTLADFARFAQSQTRFAAVLRRVDEWAAAAGAIGSPQATAEDVDLDGEAEYLLCNDRLFVVLERIGGRVTGVWLRDVVDGAVCQAAGPHVGYPGVDSEQEGAANLTGGGEVAAHRTSLLKDWWATKDGGTNPYVNDLYTVSAVTGGWRAVSSDGAVSKTVTLAAGASRLEVAYALGGAMAGQTLYIRNGLSPHTWDLLVSGQETLGAVSASDGVLSLVNTNYRTEVAAAIAYADAGHGAAWNPAAVDDAPSGGVDFATVPLRNQALTEQVELYGTGAFSFAIGFRARPSDWDGDGMPNTYEDAYPLILDPSDPADGPLDSDHDGRSNRDEYVAGTNPADPASRLHLLDESPAPAGFRLRFPAAPRREYHVFYSDRLTGEPAWLQATPSPIILPAGGVAEWVDDGSTTTPPPLAPEVTNRFYRIQADVPQ